MENINPFFSQPKQKAKEPLKPLKQIASTQTEPKKRKTRSDKCHDIKFPVRKEEKILLQMHCKQFSALYQPVKQTKFNTLLLRFALMHPDRVNWDFDYQDSKQYMHTKLLESEYADIGGPFGLAIEKGFSERKTVTCMVMSALQFVDQGGSYGEIIKQL
ncbi:hypothetical protein [Alkalihalobacillus sp. TS-13]|uniref:hypothetical protein n=1 Tax=Alkalihalobacillus sp. TS-13 TaxID=2842455 RepID=UPI001C87E748|nr:hypothetical protein [Alkalihalobacillus sp. TS-13]